MISADCHGWTCLRNAPRRRPRKRLLVTGVALILSAASPAWADSTQDKALIVAAIKGDLPGVRASLAAGANVNATMTMASFPGANENGPPFSDDLPVTPLRAAVYCGCIYTVAALLDAGADPHGVQSFALVDSIELNELDATDRLLSKYGKVQIGDPPVVGMLLHRGSPKLADALRLLAKHLLLGTPVPPEWSAEPSSYDWDLLMTPVIAASATDPVIATLGKMATADFALDNLPGPDPADTSPRKSADLTGDVFLSQALAAHGAALPSGWSQKDENQALLVSASAIGNDVGVKTMLASGAAAALPDPNGDFAVAAAAGRDRFPTLVLLLGAKGSPDLSGPKQHSPLVQTAINGDSSMAKALLTAHADPNKTDTSGDWPVRASIRHGTAGILALLVAAGADVNRRDGESRTALHDVVVSDDGLSTGDRSGMALPPSIFPILDALASAKFDFTAKDTSGRSILESNILSSPNAALLIALVQHGAPVSKAALESAENARSSELVSAFATKLDKNSLDSGLLLEALTPPNEASGAMIDALLKSSVPLPQTPDDQRGLLEEAAELPDDIALGRLLGAGLSVAVDTDNRLLYQAVRDGRPARVKLLIEHGAVARGASYNGGPLVSRLVEDDIRRPAGSPSKLGSAQQLSIATLIDAGYDASVTNNGGKTATQIASQNTDTLDALTSAVGQAGASEEPLHKAIRADDIGAVNAIIAAGVVKIDNLDSLGRTPLTYALQLKRYAEARALLLAGAQITFDPRTPYQRPDLDYATDGQLVSAFIIRLFQDRLLALPPAIDAASVASVEQEYQTNNALRLADFNWSVGAECGVVKCVGRWNGHGNADYNFMPVRSWRGDDGPNTTYKLIQYAIRSVTSGWSWVYPDGHVEQTNVHFEVTFNVNGKMAIPACSWDIQRPTCAPGIRIVNPNVTSTLQFQTDEGFESIPSDTVTVTQTGGRIITIAPGTSQIFDRSKGDLTVSMDTVNAKVFSFELDAGSMPGVPANDLTLDPSKTENRAAAYIAIARRRARIRPPSGSDDDDVVNKTTAAEIMALTGKCLQADYRTIALTALRTQARLFVALDKRVLDLRNLVIASAALTPDEIQDALKKITTLLADPSTPARSTLLDVQTALADALPAARATGSAVAHMKDDTLDEVDQQIETYQALVLEYAQYIPVQSLDGTLDPATIAAIKARLDPHDVAVSDTALGGNGKAVRAAFGLPDPSR